jgi:hypothetical protein
LISWALMANQGTQRHSKTLGNTSVSNFSTLTDTLAIRGFSVINALRPLPCHGISSTNRF